MSEIKPRTVYLMQRTDKIYDGTEIYVGSTSKTLRERLSNHKSASKLEKHENIKLYVKMHEVGLDRWEIIPLLQRTCDKKTILEFEMEKCNELNADLNMRSPFLSFDDKKKYVANYYEMNKEKIKERQAGYYEMNKEKIKKQQADYYKLNKQQKIYHCEVCDISFGYKKDLQEHLKTSRHFWKHIYSVD